MLNILLGLSMLTAIASYHPLNDVREKFVEGQFKPLIECNDRVLGNLMTLSQWIDEDGIPTTMYRITSKGQVVPRFFNRPDDHDEHQLRRVFSTVCLSILSDPSIMDGDIQ